VVGFSISNYTFFIGLNEWWASYSAKKHGRSREQEPEAKTQEQIQYDKMIADIRAEKDKFQRPDN
jgi:hypothetical protein